MFQQCLTGLVIITVHDTFLLVMYLLSFISQAFVLATSYWIGENLACYNKTQPFLPLMPLVCTASVREQAQVWHSLIGLRQDDTTRAGKPSGASLPAFPLFQALQIVRAQNNAMPTALVVSLAQNFSKLAQNATDGTWKETYAARSAHYWQKALPSLQNMARSDLVPISIHM